MGMYLKKLLEHPAYQKQLDKLECYERTRIFCKHDFSHFEEMGRIAIAMMKKYGVELEEETVLLAAYLHDMGRVAQYEKGIPHDKAGVEFARKMLQEIEYPKERTEIIAALIHGHRTNSGEMPVRIFAWADKRSRACYACKQTDACKWSEERKNRSAFTNPEQEQL